MFTLIAWLVYGLIVGLVAKALHPGDDPVGFSWTMGIGVAGSFIGGFLNWLLGNGLSPISSSGILMGVVGGVIFCAAFRWWRLNGKGKSFTGKDL